MPSPQIMELEKTLQNYSLEDKHWLLKQLIKQVGINQDNSLGSYKQKAKDLIAETISEVLTLPNDCEEEVWQKFYLASKRISSKFNEADFK